MIKTFLILTLIISTSLCAQSPQQIHDQALEENKVLLVSLHGTDWCGPCKKFVKDVSSTPRFTQLNQSTNTLYTTIDFNKQTDLNTYLQKYYFSIFSTINSRGHLSLPVPKMILINQEGLKAIKAGKNLKPSHYSIVKATSFDGGLEKEITTKSKQLKINQTSDKLGQSLEKDADKVINRLAPISISKIEQKAPHLELPQKIVEVPQQKVKSKKELRKEKRIRKKLEKEKKKELASKKEETPKNSNATEKRKTKSTKPVIVLEKPSLQEPPLTRQVSKTTLKMSNKDLFKAYKGCSQVINNQLKRKGFCTQEVGSSNVQEKGSYHQPLVRNQTCNKFIDKDSKGSFHLQQNRFKYFRSHEQSYKSGFKDGYDKNFHHLRPFEESKKGDFLHLYNDGDNDLILSLGHFSQQNGKQQSVKMIFSDQYCQKVKKVQIKGCSQSGVNSYNEDQSFDLQKECLSENITSLKKERNCDALLSICLDLRPEQIEKDVGGNDDSSVHNSSNNASST